MNVQELAYYPQPSDFSKVTFWDADFSHIDWKRHASFVIERVFGYGTEEEQQLVVKMYGWPIVSEFEHSFTTNDYNRNAKINLQKMIVMCFCGEKRLDDDRQVR